MGETCLEGVEWINWVWNKSSLVTSFIMPWLCHWRFCVVILLAVIWVYSIQFSIQLNHGSLQRVLMELFVFTSTFPNPFISFIRCWFEKKIWLKEACGDKWIGHSVFRLFLKREWWAFHLFPRFHDEWSGKSRLIRRYEQSYWWSRDCFCPCWSLSGGNHQTSHRQLREWLLL